jgi:hypothetical protein
MSTTLGRIAGNDATAAIVGQHAKNQADVATEAFPEAGAHIAALKDFGEQVSGKTRDDQLIYILYRLQAHQSDSDHYQPGENQAELFGKLGMGGPAPSAEQTLQELVACAVDDYLQNAGSQLTALRAERDQAQTALETSEAARELAESRSAAIENLESDLVAANADLDDLRRLNTHLRAMAGKDSVPTERPDWKSVEGYPNVYEKPNAKGEIVYRIGFRDDAGEQRWKTTGPNLADAIEARTAIDDQKAVAA